MRNSTLRGRRTRIVLGALALGFLAFSGTAVGGTAGMLPKQVDAFKGLDDRPEPGPGTNIFVMGTDSRESITSAEKAKFHAGGVACNCSDVMMLVHLSQKHDRVSVVSLPRDSYAEIPEYRDGDGNVQGQHPAKLNAAYAEGGAPLAVQTVEGMTGVRIDHYLQIDFRRFIDSVNTVGGVDVCTARPLKDSATKLNLAPGRHRLKGGPSLQYVRSRHVDTSADIGRLQRQQQFLVNAFRSAKLGDILANPVSAAKIARTVLGSASVDQGFGVDDLVGLARDLKRIPLSKTELGTVPIGGFNELIENVGSTLRWDDQGAERVFSALREDRPLIAPGAHPEPLDPPRLNVQRIVHGDKLACK